MSIDETHVAAHWRARDAAVQLEQAGRHAESLAWWALASVHASEVALRTDCSYRRESYRKRAFECARNALVTHGQ